MESSLRVDARYCIDMAIATQMTVEEYRNADFEGDPEYVDGEVLDRNVGEVDHSLTIRNLIFFE